MEFKGLRFEVVQSLVQGSFEVSPRLGFSGLGFGALQFKVLLFKTYGLGSDAGVEAGGSLASGFGFRVHW